MRNYICVCEKKIGFPQQFLKIFKQSLVKDTTHKIHTNAIILKWVGKCKICQTLGKGDIVVYAPVQIFLGHQIKVFHFSGKIRIDWNHISSTLCSRSHNMIISIADHHTPIKIAWKNGNKRWIFKDPPSLCYAYCILKKRT